MEQLFLKIVNMSITAGYCALAVMVLRLCLKKLPKVYSYALWLIVAFRLICPVSFESVFSLMRISPEVIPVNIAVQEAPEVSTGIGRVDMVVNRALTFLVPSTNASEAGNFTADTTAQAGENPLQTALFVVSLVWGLVAAVLLGYGIGTYLKMRQKLKNAKETEPGVFVSELLKTPFVLGFLRPAVYLPEGLSDAEREYVLEHERTHIRRLDYMVKLGAFLLLCLHWFNPILWLSYYLMCKDMEMSCDEKVIQKLSEDHTTETKKEYASTLLSLASGHRYSFGGPIAFGEGNTGKRIVNVLQYKKRTVIVSVILAVVVIVAMFLLMGNPKEDKEAGKKQPTASVTPTPEVDSTPKPTAAPMLESITGVTALDEEGTGYLYGVVSDELSGNEYFTLQIPEECVNEISYLAEIKEHTLQSIEFYMAAQVGMKKLEEIAQGGNNSGLQLVEAYRWVELKPYLEAGTPEEFHVLKQEFVMINEEGTGGYICEFPLDNILSGVALEKYKLFGTKFDIYAQLSIHRAPQTTYTEEELREYGTWLKESLGTELEENIYYAEIHNRRIVTPYFELWVPESCVDKVAYMLCLKEKEDGTKAVASLGFYYMPLTEIKAAPAEEVTDLSDYFVQSSWIGSIGWDTLEDYLKDTWEYQLLDWAKRAGSTSIRDIEPYYLQEAALVGRSFVWINEEETGAYFYYLPSDVQWQSGYEEEYQKLQAELKEQFDIIFYSEPDAVISESLWKALVDSIGVE